MKNIVVPGMLTDRRVVLALGYMTKKEIRDYWPKPDFLTCAEYKIAVDIWHEMLAAEYKNQNKKRRKGI